MAAAGTIGISKLFFILLQIFVNARFLLLFGTFFLFIQQALIITLMMRSKKMARLYKERFRTSETFS